MERELLLPLSFTEYRYSLKQSPDYLKFNKLTWAGQFMTACCTPAPFSSYMKENQAKNIVYATYILYKVYTTFVFKKVIKRDSNKNDCLTCAISYTVLRYSFLLVFGKNVSCDVVVQSSPNYTKLNSLSFCFQDGIYVCCLVVTLIQIYEPSPNYFLAPPRISQHLQKRP